jgi:hypothetical protein
MGDLSANQRRALAALLTEPTVVKAAAACELTERTLHNYLADDAFKAELRARQDQVINAATAALTGLAGTAIAALQGVLTDPEATPSARTRAALGILDQVQRLTTFADLEERIAALEGMFGDPATPA